MCEDSTWNLSKIIPKSIQNWPKKVPTSIPKCHFWGSWGRLFPISRPRLENVLKMDAPGGPKGTLWGAKGDPKVVKILQKSCEKYTCKSKLKKERKRRDSGPPRPSKIWFSLQRECNSRISHLAPKIVKKVTKMGPKWAQNGARDTKKSLQKPLQN